MTTVVLSTTQACLPDTPGVAMITVHLSNPFDTTATVIDLWGLNLAAQPPLGNMRPGGHADIVAGPWPAGTYKVGAQFHLASGEARAAETSVVVPDNACTPSITTTSSLTIAATTTTAPEVPTSSTTPDSSSSVPTVAPASTTVGTTTAPPILGPALEPTWPTTTIVEISTAVQLPRTGAGDVAVMSVVALALVVVGVALVRRARRGAL